MLIFDQLELDLAIKKCLNNKYIELFILLNIYDSMTKGRRSGMRVKLDFVGIILSSQNSRFCLNFINHSEGCMGFYQVSSFLLYTVNGTVEIRKRLRQSEEIEILRQSCRADCE
jgi:hypothetical protein